MTRLWLSEISPRRPRFALLTLIAMGSLISGCAEKRAHAYPWATAIQARPILVGTKPIAAPDLADLAPDLRFELPPPPSQLEGIHAGPARPQVMPQSGDSENSLRDQTTNLVPQLTGAEVALAQQEINQNLSIAERNLEAIHGRNRNLMQSDLLSKIMGFISDARQAAREGDWTRARNLAKKAQLLSQELLKSY